MLTYLQLASFVNKKKRIKDEEKKRRRQMEQELKVIRPNGGVASLSLYRHNISNFNKEHEKTREKFHYGYIDRGTLLEEAMLVAEATGNHSDVASFYLVCRRAERDLDSEIQRPRKFNWRSMRFEFPIIFKDGIRRKCTVAYLTDLKKNVSQFTYLAYNMKQAFVNQGD